MISEKLLIEKFKVLPPSSKQEVVDFVDFLQSKMEKSVPRKNLQGSLSHLNIDFTAEDLRQARNEMWRGYTKDTEDEDTL